MSPRHLVLLSTLAAIGTTLAWVFWDAVAVQAAEDVLFQVALAPRAPPVASRCCMLDGVVALVFAEEELEEEGPQVVDLLGADRQEVGPELRRRSDVEPPHQGPGP